MLEKKYSTTDATCRVTFKLTEEEVQSATSVQILGEFNNWNAKSAVNMKAENGVFSAIVELDTGRDYQFKYFTSNNVWLNDATADGLIDTPDAQNSIVSLPAKKAKGKKKGKKK